jgi:hypothetical protein
LDVNGLWTVVFSTATGEGTGVLTLSDGKLSGGDGNYYYLGSFKQDGSKLTGSLRVVHFAGALTNVFGPVRDLQLYFTAVAGDDLIMGQALLARPVGLGSPRMSIRLQRVSNEGVFA